MKVILGSFLLFGVAWAALNCECGKRNAGRIVGGKVTKKNEYPWMVAFTNIKNNNFTYCGGTIITPWHIVTAAHCVTLPKDNFFISVGAHDVNDFHDSTRQHPLIDQIIIHPDYNPMTLDNDIAVLVTSNEIIFNEFVSPLCMPSGLSEDKLIGLIVKAMGWGRYDYRKPNTDKIKKLREVDLEITSAEFCSRSNGMKICTWSPGKDSCRGDSGGPLAWLDPETNRFTILGIVSTGPVNCGESTSPGINTNVLHYLDWVNQKIEGTVSTTKQASTCHKI